MTNYHEFDYAKVTHIPLSSYSSARVDVTTYTPLGAKKKFVAEWRNYLELPDAQAERIVRKMLEISPDVHLVRVVTEEGDDLYIPIFSKE
jgi:hypothetical protein